MSKAESHLDLSLPDIMSLGTHAQIEQLELMAQYAPDLEISVKPRTRLTQEELGQLPIGEFVKTIIYESQDRIHDIFFNHGFTYPDGQSEVINGNMTATASILKALNKPLYDSLDVPEEDLIANLQDNLQYNTGTLMVGHVHWLHNLKGSIENNENVEVGIEKTQERFKKFYSNGEDYAVDLALALKRVDNSALDDLLLSEKDAHKLYAIGGDKKLPEIAQLFPGLVILGIVSEKTLEEQKKLVIERWEDLNSDLCLENNGVEPLWLFSFVSDVARLKEMVDFNNKNTTSADLQVA